MNFKNVKHFRVFEMNNVWGFDTFKKGDLLLENLQDFYKFILK